MTITAITDRDDPQRLAYEAWVRKKPGSEHLLRRRDFPGSERLGQYGNHAVEFGWQAWQEHERAAWLPIAGAPMDGTPVLVTIDGVPGSTGEAHWWQNEEGRGGWQTWDGANRRRTVYETAPTHYRPLPPGPNTGAPA